MNKKEKILKTFYNLFFVLFSVLGLLTSIKIAHTLMIILWSIDLAVWIWEFIIVVTASTKDKKN